MQSQTRSQAFRLGAIVMLCLFEKQKKVESIVYPCQQAGQWGLAAALVSREG